MLLSFDRFAYYRVAPERPRMRGQQLDEQFNAKGDDSDGEEAAGIDLPDDEISDSLMACTLVDEDEGTAASSVDLAEASPHPTLAELTADAAAAQDDPATDDENVRNYDNWVA